jgi:hypothetical protein
MHNAYRLPEDLAELIDVAQATPPQDLTVACYTFPHYHRSALNDRLYGPGWTEYVLMRGGRPWYPGHKQPRHPLLGELDEQDPETWYIYNDLAADHGVDVFLWDTYWYDGQPAFHGALEDGFLGAKNLARMRFAVMWTNHPWTKLFPTVHTDGTASWPPAFESPDGRLEDIWRSFSYLITRYLHHPQYWRLDGRPVICIWNVGSLRDGLGIDRTRDLLDDLREFARKLGHDGLHFHVCFTLEAYADLVAIGADSYGFYQPIVHAAGRRPMSEEVPDYGTVAGDVVQHLWREADELSSLPFFPSVSPGWDTTPRFTLRREVRHGNRALWPGTTYWGDPMLVDGENPAAFTAFVKAAIAFLQQRKTFPRVLTIGCWNEWTEGHYLLPDTNFGHGMLEALREAVSRREFAPVRK